MDPVIIRPMLPRISYSHFLKAVRLVKDGRGWGMTALPVRVVRVEDPEAFFCTSVLRSLADNSLMPQHLRSLLNTH